MKIVSLIFIIYSEIILISANFMKKVDLAPYNLIKNSSTAVFKSSSQGFFLIGKFGEYPIFEYNQKENSWVTSCDICDMSSWDFKYPELIVSNSSIENEIFYLSALILPGLKLEYERIKIDLNYLENSICPQYCYQKGKCIVPCECKFGYIGNECQTKLNKLKLNSATAQAINGYEWKFFYTQLNENQNYIHVEFDEQSSTDLHVYMSPSSYLNDFPTMKSYRNHISFPEKKDMLSRFFIQEKYLLWGFFCSSYRPCLFKLDLELKSQSHQRMYLHILIASTVSVFAFIGFTYVLIKSVKKLRNRCYSAEEQERLIKKEVMNICFPQRIINITDKDNDQCCICLNNFTESKVRKLGCNHIFHSVCIDIWTANNIFCPLCKSPIFLSDALLRVSPRRLDSFPDQMFRL